MDWCRMQTQENSSSNEYILFFFNLESVISIFSFYFIILYSIAGKVKTSIKYGLDLVLE